MSPAILRRYRAERLLREEFESLRAKVIVGTRGRLRASGVAIDGGDLEACYAQAWQGLYTAMLAGQEIANPGGWLALVTYRRAIEECRAGGRLARAGCAVRGASHEPDFAAELDDRMRLRRLFEALRGRLSAREQEAAALCYLQGLSRSQAASRMGLSEARMRKLMDGRGAGSPGVAGKVGALVETIRADAWCEQQGSLMRGFAFGILDPQGERYRLAQLHREQCPACRAYVLSLRGLAAVLPPVPSLVHLLLSGGAIAANSAGSGTGSAAGAGAGATSGGACSGAGALSASGTAGAGAAGGGWLLAGAPAGAKLAVGCVLALGFGAGCVALGSHPARTDSPPHRRAPADRPRSHQQLLALDSYASATYARRLARAGSPSAAGSQGTQARAASGASREFGLEQPGATASRRGSGSAPASGPSARAASVASRVPGTARSPRLTSASTLDRGAAGPPRAAGTPAATREFAPG